LGVKLKQWQYWLFIVTFSVLGLSGLFMINYQNTYAHENIHKAVSRNFGCVNESININTFSSSYFICHKYENRTHDMKLREETLHSINEIVTYNVVTLLAAMFFFFFIIGALIIILGHRIEDTIE